MKTFPEITFEQFERVDLRVGTIVRIEDFPEARVPAYKLWIDFGPEIGVKTSSSQLTEVYSKEDLLGKQVIGVMNFPPKKVGPFVSEVLTTGFKRSDGKIIVATPDQPVPNGEKLY